MYLRKNVYNEEQLRSCQNNFNEHSSSNNRIKSLTQQILYCSQ